ncbi:MAG: class I SAM-dependent methyltransferase [Hyphomicrobiaceae bacterium]
MGWIEYWDDKPTIYVNRRHREAHYRGVADGLIANLGDGFPVVLDYGCGEALFAGDVARRCKWLYLCDAAPNVRAELRSRFESIANISVVAPEDLAALPAGSLDLIVANSVIQYLSTAETDQCLDEWHRLLAPAGRLLVADVIPPSVGPLTDALALLDFGRRQGFLFAAGIGLVRTFFSNYRKVRASLGLRQYEADALIARLAAHGLTARRHYPNLGHNRSRMAFIGTRANAEVPPLHV